MLSVLRTQAKKRSHRTRRIGSDGRILFVAQKMSNPQDSHRVDPNKVSLQNRERLLRRRSIQKRLQSCEYVLYSVSVILEHVSEVVGVFVLSATIKRECFEHRERTGFAHPQA